MPIPAVTHVVVRCPNLVLRRRSVTTVTCSFGDGTTSSSVTDDVAAKQKRVVRVHSSLIHPQQQDGYHHNNHNHANNTTRNNNKCLDYVRGWAWQTVLLQQRLERKRHQLPTEEDAVLLLEHEPVYTLGRGADENHLVFLQDNHNNNNNNHNCAVDENRAMDRHKLSRRARGAGSARLALDRAQMDRMGGGWTGDSIQTCVDQLLQATTQVVSPVICPTNGAPIYRVERGGEVTFHGPGQLVVYPLLDLSATTSCWSLSHYKRDLHWFLRQMEQVIIDTLDQLGLEGARRDDAHTGVWIRDKKIAAVGVTASHWITTHGLALNVCPDLAYFDTQTILPCGIEGKGVTSLEEEGVKNVSVHQVAQVVLQNMGRVFGVELLEGDRIH